MVSEVRNVMRCLMTPSTCGIHFTQHRQHQTIHQTPAHVTTCFLKDFQWKLQQQLDTCVLLCSGRVIWSPLDSIIVGKVLTKTRHIYWNPIYTISYHIIKISKSRSSIYLQEFHPWLLFPQPRTITEGIFQVGLLRDDIFLPFVFENERGQ